MRSTIKKNLEQVVTIVTTLGRLIPMAQPTTCVLTMAERTKTRLDSR